MTIVQRRRAKKLQNVTYLYSRGCRAWLGLLLTSVLRLIILALVIFFGREDDQLFIMFPCMSLFSMLPFFICLFTTMGIEKTINEKSFHELYHSSSTPSAFLCCMPFEARDMANLKFTLWEKAAAVDVLMIAVGHIASLIAEARGFTIYNGVSGLFTLAAFITEIVFMIPYIFESNGLMISVGVFIGLGFAMMCGLMDEIYGMSADTLAPLKIFSGISGILIYCAATVLIAFLGEMYIKHRKNVSWRLSK